MLFVHVVGVENCGFDKLFLNINNTAKHMTRLRDHKTFSDFSQNSHKMVVYYKMTIQSCVVNKVIYRHFQCNSILSVFQIKSNGLVFSP